MALLDNSAQVNTIMPRYVNEHSLQVGPMTDLMGSKVACVGLDNAYTQPLGYVVIQVQVDKDKWGKWHGPPRQQCTGEYHHAELCKCTFPTGGFND